jgi:hypothetical protein
MPPRIPIVGGGLALASVLGRHSMACEVVEREPTAGRLASGDAGPIPRVLRATQNITVTAPARAAQ